MINVINVINVPYYVTGSEKTAHFAQDFKIKLLVLNGRIVLAITCVVLKVTRCRLLACSVQSFLSTIVN